MHVLFYYSIKIVSQEKLLALVIGSNIVVPLTNIHIYIRSVQFVNLRNFEIAVHKLEILKLQTNFKTGVRFQNCTVQFQNFGIDREETVCSDDECRRNNHQSIISDSILKCSKNTTPIKTISKGKGQKIMQLFKIISVAVK